MATGRGWVTGYGMGAYEKGGYRSRLQSPVSPLSPSSAQTATTNSDSASQIPPREIDAGPVSPHLFRDDTNNETLPPDYRQLFEDRLSDRASRLLRRTPRGPPIALPTTSTDLVSLPLTMGSTVSPPAFQPVLRP